MDGKFIIVEGELDRQLLAAILPALPAHIKLVAAGGYSAALSKAATVLAYLHQDALLALDTDTTDDQAALEKQQFVYDYLKGSRNGNQFELTLFRPTLLDYLTGYMDVMTDGEIITTRKPAKERIQEVLAAADLTKYWELPAIKSIVAFAQQS